MSPPARIPGVALALAGALAAAAGCHESTAPQTTMIALAPAGRLVVVSSPGAGPVTDTALVTLRGPGAARASWRVSHGAAPWVTLATTGGTGDGPVIWTRDPRQAIAGVWVDTITVTVTGSRASAQLVDSLGISGPLPSYVTVRRPWLPGERDAVVGYIGRNQSLGPFSDAVDTLLAASDSVTVAVPNPALAAAPPGLPRSAYLGQAGQAWVLVGLQFREVFPNPPGSATLDSLRWLGVFWFASPESTWTGRVLAATSAATLWGQAVDSVTFDTSGGKAGAAGGESRAGTGELWQAISGTLFITQNTCSPSSCANQTFVSGPYQGGQWHGLQIGGSLSNIIAPCVQPTGCAAPPDTFNVSFLSVCFFGYCFGSPIPGLYINCVFPTPCTGPAAARAAELARRHAPFVALTTEAPLDTRRRAEGSRRRAAVGP